MTDVLVLYRGARVHNLELVTANTDGALVREFAARMVTAEKPRSALALGRLDDGRRPALGALVKEGGGK